MSRDAWMKKKANVGGDNGWAEMVSVAQFIITNNGQKLTSV